MLLFKGMLSCFWSASELALVAHSPGAMVSRDRHLPPLCKIVSVASLKPVEQQPSQTLVTAVRQVPHRLQPPNWWVRHPLLQLAWFCGHPRGWWQQMVVTGENLKSNSVSSWLGKRLSVRMWPSIIVRSLKQHEFEPHTHRTDYKIDNCSKYDFHQ